MAMTGIGMPKPKEKSGGGGVGSIIGGVLGAVGGTLIGAGPVAGYAAGSGAGAVVGNVVSPGGSGPQIKGVQAPESMQRRLASSESSIDYNQTSQVLADSYRALEQASPEIRAQYEAPLGKALVMSINKSYSGVA